MSLTREFSVEFTRLLSFLQLGLHHVDQEFLCLNHGNLYVAVRFAVEHQLVGKTVGETGKHFRGFGSKFGGYEIATVAVGFQNGKLCLMTGQNIVQLGNQLLHGRHKLHNTSGIKIVPKLSPLAARLATTSAISVTKSSRVMPFCSTSSEMMVMLGCVSRAHSRQMCEAERPIRRIKW